MLVHQRLRFADNGWGDAGGGLQCGEDGTVAVGKAEFGRQRGVGIGADEFCPGVDIQCRRRQLVPSQFPVHAADYIICSHFCPIPGRAVHLIESGQGKTLLEERFRGTFLANHKNPGRGSVGTLGQIQSGCHSGGQDFATVHRHPHPGKFVDILLRRLAGVIGG